MRRLFALTTFALVIAGAAAAAVAAAAGAAAEDPAPANAGAESPQGEMQVQVTLDAAGQSGAASATVRVHASREVIWPLITSCAEELKIVPGLVDCTVAATSADGSSQIIRHVLDYSWYVPRLRYDVRATYVRPVQVNIERISGDFLRLKGSWTLQSDGEFTWAHYSVDLAPGFWVPRWLVRAALKRDLPKMMRALQARAEASAAARAGDDHAPPISPRTAWR